MDALFIFNNIITSYLLPKFGNKLFALQGKDFNYNKI